MRGRIHESFHVTSYIGIWYTLFHVPEGRLREFETRQVGLFVVQKLACKSEHL